MTHTNRHGTVSAPETRQLQFDNRAATVRSEGALSLPVRAEDSTQIDVVGTASRRPARRSPTFDFVDLFAGIGGFRLGLEAVGGRCVHTVELDRHARQTYEAWFGQPPEGADIRDVQTLPPHQVLAAGFPCQPFSLAGVSKKRSLGRHDGFLDKTQGTLFFELSRLIAAARPPVILLENVRNLRSHDGGRTFDVILETLERELDYAVAWNIVDARAWVPQHRERIFFVGLDRRVFKGRRFTFPDAPEERPVLASILEDEQDVDGRYVLSPHLWQYLQDYATKHRLAGNGFGYGLAGPEDVARTLSARYHKDGSEILIKTSQGPPRRLTPRECARLMGFPDDRAIVVSDTQAYRQFGNAVVVPVIEDLGRAIANQAGFSKPIDQGREMRRKCVDGPELGLHQAVNPGAARNRRS